MIAILTVYRRVAFWSRKDDRRPADMSNSMTYGTMSIFECGSTSSHINCGHT